MFVPRHRRILGGRLISPSIEQCKLQGVHSTRSCKVGGAEWVGQLATWGYIERNSKQIYTVTATIYGPNWLCRWYTFSTKDVDVVCLLRCRVLFCVIRPIGTKSWRQSCWNSKNISANSRNNPIAISSLFTLFKWLHCLFRTWRDWTRDQGGCWWRPQHSRHHWEHVRTQERGGDHGCCQPGSVDMATASSEDQAVRHKQAVCIRDSGHLVAV